MENIRCVLLLCLLGASRAAAAEPAPACALSESNYQGWRSQCLANALVELQVVPEIGGRVMQFRFGTKEFLWVNPQLAGKLSPPSGLADDGSWLNYGGNPAGELARCNVPQPAVATPWPVGKIRAWYDQQPWLVGCNFLPSTAVNDVEMWQAETFDPVTIDRELGWAHDLGFNTVRVFINYVVWEADAAGLKKRFEDFLQIAGRHDISVMPILFDDCNFAGRITAAGPQPDPVPGIHNSQWVSSPPLAMVTDRATWPKLAAYVQDMVGSFGNDQRVVIWDLYNEPGNSGLGEQSQPLMEATFSWARAVKPIQPLTIGAWEDFNRPLSRRMLELSDIVSYHGYDSPAGIEAKLKVCATYDRPVICTEWLVRRDGNTFETLLPLFRDRKIGCWNWGLVAGRTQTYFPWGSPQNAPEPQRWQHDIFRADGTPFNTREVQYVKVLTGVLPASALPQRQLLVPTAEKNPVDWRYTLEQPTENWFKPDFPDGAWKPGAAPFGREELNIARKPNTVWSSADIWLRRTFEMPAGQFSELTFLLHHDEDTEVYLNGVLALRASGFNAGYETFDISPAARATLKPGPNTLAIHCHQTGGGQYLDLGIEGVSGVAR
ncbi:MAG: cellulase family glycosylhydrolase [Pirellulaceae bacterium]